MEQQESNSGCLELIEIFILKLYAGNSSRCYKKCFQQVALFGPRDLNFELFPLCDCLGSKLSITGEDFCLNNTQNKCYQSQIATDKQALVGQQ